MSERVDRPGDTPTPLREKIAFLLDGRQYRAEISSLPNGARWVSSITYRVGRGRSVGSVWRKVWPAAKQNAVCRAAAAHLGMDKHGDLTDSGAEIRHV